MASNETGGAGTPPVRKTISGSDFAAPARKFKNLALSACVPLAIVLLWEYLGRTGQLNRSILPYPSMLGECLRDMLVSGKLQKHLSISAIRVVQGFAIGCAAGLAAGTLCGFSKRWNTLLSSMVGLLRPIPMIAWVPLLILWMGIDERSKVTLIAIGTFWPVLLNTTRGIRHTDKKLLEVGAMFEKNPWQMFSKVIFPGAFPFIFTGVRLGVSNAWSCVVTAEAIAAASGVGYMIMYARELMQPDVLLVGVLTIGVVGLLLEILLLRVERRILSWNDEMSGSGNDGK
ncbi:MAG: ABC transporter permease [Candidatus Accumulibacter sp.]|jgi:sulfonate transport system permease protein|nr:ABC transporter permease [Accumulibacter sp.]